MPAFVFGPAHLVHPAQEISQYVERLISQQTERARFYRGPNRRSEDRHQIALPVRVLPIDRHLQPIGDSFVGMTRDLSSGGISIIHSANMDAECRFLAVELCDADQKYLQAAVEILRRADAGPFKEIAGRFVTKVRRFNPFARLN